MGLSFFVRHMSSPPQFLFLIIDFSVPPNFSDIPPSRAVAPAAATSAAMTKAGGSSGAPLRPSPHAYLLCPPTVFSRKKTAVQRHQSRPFRLLARAAPLQPLLVLKIAEMATCREQRVTTHVSNATAGASESECTPAS